MLVRSLGVCSVLFALQLLYYLFIVEFEAIYLTTVTVLFLLLVMFLVFISPIEHREFSIKHEKIFLIFFLLTFVSTILSSRLDYILSTITFGLAETRNSVPSKAGGTFSFLNAFFYPLALIALLTNWRQRLSICLLLPILVIDVIFLGTRNSVFFVIVFWFIHSVPKLSIKKYALLGLLIVSTLVLAFEYTVFERSAVGKERQQYWESKIDYTHVGSLNSTNPELHGLANKVHWGIYPTAHLISYLSHSTSEFVYFVREAEHKILPSFLHVQDKIRMATFQDRSLVQEQLADAKGRYGFYQTMFATLQIELGVFWVPCLFILLLWFRFGGLVSKIAGSYFVVIFALGLVENYLFTGLTIIRFGIFVLLGVFFLRSRTIVKTPKKPETLTT